MRAIPTKYTIGLLLAVGIWAPAGCGENAPAKPTQPSSNAADKSVAAEATKPVAPRHDTIRFKITDKSPRTVGMFAADVASAKSGRGEAGALHFGPYAPLKQGSYRATFRLRGEGKPGTTVGKVDVNVFDEKKPEALLGAAPIIADAGGRLNDVSVDFEGKGEVRHEFRVFVNGEGAVELLEVWVTPR